MATTTGPPAKKAKVSSAEADIPAGCSARDLCKEFVIRIPLLDFVPKARKRTASAAQPLDQGSFKFWQLPAELRENILFYLNQKETLRLSATTKDTRTTVLSHMTQIEQNDYGPTLRGGCAQLTQVGCKRVRKLVRRFLSFLTLTPSLDTLYLTELVLHVAAIEGYKFPVLPNLGSIRLSVCSQEAASYLKTVGENTPLVSAVYITKANRACGPPNQLAATVLTQLKWHPRKIDKLALVNFGSGQGGCLSKIQRYANISALDIRRSSMNQDGFDNLLLPAHFLSVSLRQLCLSLGKYILRDSTTTSIRDLANLQFLEAGMTSPHTRLFRDLPAMTSLTHLHLTDWSGRMLTIRDMSVGLVALFSSDSRFTHVGFSNMQGVTHDVIHTLITKQNNLKSLVVSGSTACDFPQVTEESFEEVAGLTSLELLIWLDTSTSKVTGDFITEFDPETHPHLRFVGIYVSKPTSVVRQVQHSFGGRALFSTSRLRYNDQRARLYDLAVSVRPDFACCASLVKNENAHRAIEPMW